MKRYVVSILLILLVVQTLGLATDIIVPSRRYQTIQDAIDGAVNGDTITLLKNPNSYYPVSYSGPRNVNLDFHGKAITLKSEINLNNPEPDWDTISSTIIDCGGLPENPLGDTGAANRAFWFHTAETETSRVIGLTIRNGYARGPKGADALGGYVGYPLSDFESVPQPWYDDPCEAPPLALEGADAFGDAYGGAILCYGAVRPTIKYCIIRDCTVTGAHGGRGADGLNGEWSHWTKADFNEATGEPNPDAEMEEDVPNGQWGGSGGIGSGQGYGGAIACRNGASPTVSGCNFINNKARGGRGGDGGRGGNGAGVNFQDGEKGGGGDANDSIGNGMGGAIYAGGNCNPAVENCYFSNNAALSGERALGGERGYGTVADPPAPRGMDGDVILDPTFVLAGGAAYFAHNSDVSFTNCTLTGNKAYWEYFPYFLSDYSFPVYTLGGALYSENGNVVTLNTCDFTDNLGGAVYVEFFCEVNINNDYAVSSGDPNRRCLFQGNSEALDGGAVFIDEHCHADIRNCNFGGNSAVFDGGAIKLMSDASFVNCSFGYNTANGQGGGFTGYGGAIDAFSFYDTLILNFSDCSFSSNQSVYGGAFSSEFFVADFNDCYFIGNAADMGGAMDLGYGDLYVTGGAITSNQAGNGDGGGLNCRDVHAEIFNCNLQNNLSNGADSSGGAIMLRGAAPFEVKNCLLAGNETAVDGGAIFCNGTGLVNPAIKNCAFSGDSAGGNGGAIFADWASWPEITDCIFEGCNGYAIHEEDYGGNATASYCLFFNNPDGDYYDSVTRLTYSGSGQVGSIPGGVENKYGDPLFLTGPLGSCYLTQTPVQLPPSSPAVNAGSVDLDDPGFDPVIYGWDPRDFTTRTDNVGDTGQVDIGYHYIKSTYAQVFQLTTSVAGGQGTIQPPSGNFYAGAVVTLTATPAPGWRVNAWTGTDNDASTSTTNSIVMNSNRVVTVSFRQPKTLLVRVGGGPGYYSTIQDAVGAAKDGDTVVVYSGVYYGGYQSDALIVDESITIRSVYPDDPCCVADTIIDGYRFSQFNEGYTNLGVTFGSNTDNNTILNGFTIRNCGGYWGTAPFDGDRGRNHPDGYDGPSGVGAAIRVLPGASPIIRNCVIRDNVVLGGDATNGVGASEFENAGRGGWGGFAWGGAVYCSPNCSPAFINCRIINNEVEGGNGGDGGDEAVPGGYPNYGGNWSMRGTPEDLAIYYDPFSLDRIFVTDANLWEMWNWDDAAGYWPLYGDYTRTSYFGDYRWYSGYGGGVFIDQGCNITFENCTISGNRAAGGVSGQGGNYVSGRPQEPLIPYEIPSFGGGVYCAANSTVIFTDCTLANNISSEPNELNNRLDPYIGHGGGVCAEDSASVMFNNCRFEENSASVGGGIHGGSSTLMISDCEFVSNTAYQGAGLFGNNSLVTIVASNFIDNTTISDPNDPNVLGEGGGLHFWAVEANIIDSSIIGNEAEYSGGGLFFGGEGASTLLNCLVAGNTAGRDGGGISANVFAQLTISNCTVADNETTGQIGGTDYGGGLYCSYESNIDISDSIFWDNSSTVGSQIAIAGIGSSPSGADVFYSDVQGGESGIWVDVDCILNWLDGNINADPLFVGGPRGNYYLSQSTAQLPPNSPAVNAGSVDLDDPDFDPVGYGWDPRNYTTRTDNIGDSGRVDMGCHYFFGGGEIQLFELAAYVVGGHGSLQTQPIPVMGGLYYSGTIVTLTAVPDPGWRVKSWSGTDNDTSTAKTNTVTIDSDKTVTVEFEESETLIVKIGGGGSYYSNIQEALQDARDGDTIIVLPGTYLGPAIQINRSVEIRSEQPDDPSCVAATIIDRTAYANRAFDFVPGSDGVVVNGFTIQNCRWFVLDGGDGDRDAGHPNGYDGYPAMGAAVFIYAGVSPTFKNCIFQNNWIRGGHGGNGVGATDTENAGRGGWGAWAHGGAIYCGPGSSAEFINCQILNNEAVGGNGGNGGNYQDNGGTANYGGNWSSPYAINIDPESLNIEFVEGDLWEVWEWDYADVFWPFFGEPGRTSYIGDYRYYSGYGGGVYCSFGSNVTFTDCTIAGNSTRGGMSGEGGDREGEDPEPETSFELPSFGGGIYCAADSNVVFNNCTFTDNIASEMNDPPDYRLDPYIGYGGGVCAEDSATVIFKDCTFGENSASVGGGLYVGNAIMEISDCEFVFNSAYHGAGLTADDGQATVFGSVFANNIASSEVNGPDVLGQGGSMYFWASDANVIDCNINNNQAQASGGGIYFGGQAAPLVFNCLLTNNTAGRGGGAITATILTQLTISNCTVVNNSATGVGFVNNYGGGLFCSYDSSVDVIDSIFWGNSSTNGPQIGIGFKDNASEVSVSYSDIRGGRPNIYVDTGCVLNWGTGNINVYPGFVPGPLGGYYLSQTDTGDPLQTSDSPCVGTGSDYASILGLHLYTTRTDEQPDRGIVDMGYHYPFSYRLEPCSYCDLHSDGFINFVDYAKLLLRWLEEGCSGVNDWCGGADVTFDTRVDFRDLAFLTECWLANDASGPGPDPAEWKTEPEPDPDSPTSAIRMAAVSAMDAWGISVEYYFECVDGDCDDSGWQDEPNYIDDNLESNAEYGYRVKTRDARENESGWSVIRYVLTEQSGQQPGAPAPPSNLVATAISNEQINLSWTDNSTDESGFRIERSTEGGPYQEIASVAANQTTYSNTGLEAETTYGYRVFAYNVIGDSVYSNVATETTLEGAADITPPAPVPVITSAYEYIDGYNYWHFVIEASATATDDSGQPVYYRVICVQDSALNSNNIPENSPLIVGGVLTYVTPSKPSYYGTTKNYTRTFRVCVYDQTGNEACSANITIDRYTPFP